MPDRMMITKQRILIVKGNLVCQREQRKYTWGEPQNAKREIQLYYCISLKLSKVFPSSLSYSLHTRGMNYINIKFSITIIPRRQGACQFFTHRCPTVGTMVAAGNMELKRLSSAQGYGFICTVADSDNLPTYRLLLIRPRTLGF